jgi:hypothetical protein
VKPKRIFTKGNIEVQDIKIGDIHYEYSYNFYMKVEVISLPVSTPNSDGTPYWSWQSKVIKSENIIDYGVDPEYSHFGPNLYDYPAYGGIEL